jgi:cytochrome c2
VALSVAAGRTWQQQQRSESVAVAMTGGDPARAPAAIRRYGCGGCHTIPGIPGGDGQVGGPLADTIHRVYVGGVVTNSPENLVQWIVSPQAFSPRSAMPATGISEAEARDVAAYLYSR